MAAVGGDNLKRLWLRIDQQYLLYLIAEDSKTKNVEKMKLNRFIREYLNLAPDNRKYIFRETAQIIRKSACTNPDFSPIQASVAWDAIAKYAINLVLKPWRKEYHELKLYCGYFKYIIDDCLVDADVMFELMGFYHIGNGIMTITDVLDPDKITNVSRDSFVAAIECHILGEIHENVTSYYYFDWLEILEYRERHTGSADQAIKTLKFHRRQLLYEQARAQRKAEGEDDLPDNDSSNAENPDPVPTNRSNSSQQLSVAPANVVLLAYPVQEQARLCSSEFQRQAPIVSAAGAQEQAQILPFDEAQQAVNDEDDDDDNDDNDESHSLNGSNDFAQEIDDEVWESYVCHPNYRSFDSDQSSVPTGQLIQLDSTQFQVHEPPKEYLENDDDDDDGAAAAASFDGKLEKDEISSDTGKAKQNGSDQWDDWTYLDNYLNKPMGERGAAAEEGNQDNSPDAEDQCAIFKKVKIRSNKTGEQKPRTEQGRDEHGREANPVIKRDVPTSGPSRMNLKKRNDSEIEIYVEENPESIQKSKFGDEDEDEDDDSLDDQWQCITCTFLNTKEKSICEMCFKSKETGSFRPRLKRGVMCKKCTLINDEGNHFCDACGQRLTLAAIFI